MSSPVVRGLVAALAVVVVLEDFAQAPALALPQEPITLSPLAQAERLEQIRQLEDQGIIPCSALSPAMAVVAAETDKHQQAPVLLEGLAAAAEAHLLAQMQGALAIRPLHRPRKVTQEVQPQQQVAHLPAAVVAQARLAEIAPWANLAQVVLARLLVFLAHLSLMPAAVAAVRMLPAQHLPVMAAQAVVVMEQTTILLGLLERLTPAAVVVVAGITLQAPMAAQAAPASSSSSTPYLYRAS